MSQTNILKKLSKESNLYSAIETDRNTTTIQEK